MNENEFQAAFAALQSLKNGMEQLVVNQAVEIAKLKAELAKEIVLQPITPLPEAPEAAVDPALN